MSTLDFKMNSDPQCNSGTGEDTGLCECNCRCQNHQHAFAAKKADIMSDSVYPVSGVSIVGFGHLVCQKSGP